MEYKNKKILVTGGTGFIGSYIVNLLIDKGCDVSCLTLNNDLPKFT